ncbi:MAG: hypothetical protein II220_10200, partial [Spirochaetales bacterium]|nr:hypothetical protein [Spirochaetales bacterium]
IVATSGGIGIFWWEPTAVSTPNFPSALENTTLFDLSVTTTAPAMFFHSLNNKKSAFKRLLSIL